MRESSSSRGEILNGNVPRAGFEASPETALWWCRAALLHRCHRAFAPQDTPGFGLHVLQKPWSASPTSAYAGREIVPDVTLDLEYKTETLVRSLIPAFTRYSRYVVSAKSATARGKAGVQCGISQDNSAGASSVAILAGLSIL